MCEGAPCSGAAAKTAAQPVALSVARAVSSASGDAWLLLLGGPLGRYLRASEVCAAFCAQSLALGLGGGRACVHHLSLGRAGDDGRDVAVLEGARWDEILSVRATQTSLYAVHDGLERASSLRSLDVELFFPEPIAEVLPLHYSCVANLRTLVLRICYDELLSSLADALDAGSFCSLRELRLLGSPKGASARARGLRWPPSRSGLAQPPADCQVAVISKQTTT